MAWEPRIHFHSQRQHLLISKISRALLRTLTGRPHFLAACGLGPGLAISGSSFFNDNLALNSGRCVITQDTRFFAAPMWLRTMNQ